MSIDLPCSSHGRLDGLRLLSICTSTAKSSVFASSMNNAGQFNPGALVFQAHGRESASMIFRMIDQALEQANLSDFDLLAFDRGPGAFTGVRIGCGVAQGLGLGKSIPVVGVNALAAQAMHIALSMQPVLIDGPFCSTNSRLCGVAIDARMGEVYCAAYQIRLGQTNAQSIDYVAVLEPTVCNAAQAAEFFERLQSTYPLQKLLLGGNGFSEEGLHRSLFEWASSRQSSYIEMLRSEDLDAEKIAFLAMSNVESRLTGQWAEGACREILNETFPAALAAPEYVRNNVALDKTQQAQLRLDRSR